jgi:hypothetical protein
MRSPALPAAGDGAAGHDADEMGAVFRTGMDIGVEPVLRDRDVLDRLGGEGARQCRLHLGDTEDAGAGAGAGDENPDPASHVVVLTNQECCRYPPIG